MLLLSLAIAVVIIAIVLIIAITLIMSLKNHHRQKLTVLSNQLKSISQQTDILRSEVTELRAGLLSVGKRVLKVEVQNKDFVQQQESKKYDDPDAKIYSRAVKMIALGADLEEVMRECELPKAEAELLFSLHKTKGA